MTSFLGYESTTAEAAVVGIIAEGELCEQLSANGSDSLVSVVLDRSPFYGESGGQVGDTGEIVGEGLKFEVVDTQKEGGLIVHLGHLRKGVLKAGAKVTAKVDTVRRQGIRRAHSATHMLHHALQKFVGRHAQQQGSKVDADWLRFDFSNATALGPELVAKVESDVNEKVLEGAKIQYRSLPIAQAREAGAMMLFGEKYPDIVRMVSMGEFSKELCGGTHLDNTGQVGLFKILAEESVSSGTRRITALTGTAAVEHTRQTEAALRETAAVLKVQASAVPARVTALAKEVRELKKQLAAGSLRSGELSVDKLLADAAEKNDTRIVVAEAPGADAGAMRQLIDQLRKKASPIAVMLGSRDGEKVTLVAGISRDLEQRGLHAGQWIASAAEIVGGRGGGKSDLAQAGGRHPDKLPAALSAGKEQMETMLDLKTAGA